MLLLPIEGKFMRWHALYTHRSNNCTHEMHNRATHAVHTFRKCEQPSVARRSGRIGRLAGCRMISTGIRHLKTQRTHARAQLIAIAAHLFNRRAERACGCGE